MIRFTLDWSSTDINGPKTITSFGQTASIYVSGIHFDKESEAPTGIAAGGLVFKGGSRKVQITFDEPVRNIAFKLSQSIADTCANWGEAISIVALDADGHLVAVSFEDSGISGRGHSARVKIAGPILSLTLTPTADDAGQIEVGNITFACCACPDKTPSTKGSEILRLIGADIDSITPDPNDPNLGIVVFTDGMTLAFSEIDQVIPCFTPGTAIATPKGEVPVEDLMIGDRILTRDNGIQTITWVGKKRIDHEQIKAIPELRPIKISAGCLGDGLPERDMLVSPSHRILIVSEMAQLYFEQSEVLVPAKHMLAMKGVEVSNAPYVTYIHMMCENHQIVLSDGAWSESFQPGDHTLKGFDGSQRDELFLIFPELATKEGLKEYRAARRTLKKHEANLIFKK